MNHYADANANANAKSAVIQQILTDARYFRAGQPTS